MFSGVLETDGDGFTYANTETGLITFKENLGDDEVRCAINSVGEGAILLVDIGGDIEAGDYVESNLIIGNSQKQSDDITHNYTCAKIVIDCNFEVDSDLYECWELDNSFRVALLPCSYIF